MKPKLFNLSLFAILTTYKQISVKAKWLNSKKSPWRRNEILFEKKPSLHKKFWSIYCQVLGVTWPNFTNKISEKYYEQVFHKKAVLKNFAIFTEKHPCWSLFLNKKSGLQSWNFIKTRLQHRCFPVDIAKFSRTSVLKNIFERLFERFPTWANNIKSNIGNEEDIFSKAKQKQ